MNKQRCGPEDMDKLFIQYHDDQWGKPTFDDNVMFEFLVLESFQAGLNWNMILQKRESFRKALDEFDYQKIAKYDKEKLSKLLKNEDIIRNQPKLEATINNAAKFIEVQEEYGSFSQFVWAYVDNKPIDNKVKNYKNAKSSNELSSKIAEDLKDKGFQFIGPTVIYSFMEAMGLINNHEVSCFRYEEVKNVELA